MSFLSGRLNTLTWWTSAAHVIIGLVCAIVAGWLKAEERGHFRCPDSTGITEDFCYSRYVKTYDSPLPYFGFAVLNVSFVYIATLICSLFLCIIDCIDGKAKIVYLVLQLLSGTFFTFIQHGLLYPNGFPTLFNCKLPNSSHTTSHTTTCNSSSAANKDVIMVFVFIVNIAVAFVSLAELIYLLRRSNFQFFAFVSGIWSQCCKIQCCRVKGKYIKWIRKSVKHRSILEELVKTIADRTSKVKKIGVYYVCFEDRFRIGKGSNGTDVFVGLSTDGLEVAIKRLNLEFNYLAETEIDILNSPKLGENLHVLNYRFYTESKKKMKAYLVLDLQEENLKQFVLSRDHSLAELQDIGPKILRQILLGIDPLHDANILHRDLKPENILVDFEGKMILADFGICRRLPPGHTVHESIMRGTEGWMAVESLPNDFDDNLLSCEEIRVRYKKQSDVQVLAMLFYFVLTKGYHPFGKWSFDRLSNIRKDEYDLSKLTDPVAKDLIQWMLQTDFTKRPTVKQCLKHPFFNSPERNFGFLKAVGNEKEIKTKDPASIVVQELNEEASLTTLSWKGKIDGEVYIYLSRHRRYTDDVADLLRFIRNADTHWNDRPRPPSVQQKVGIPSTYFLNLFPTLAVIVHRILRNDPGWRTKDDMKDFF